MSRTTSRASPRTTADITVAVLRDLLVGRDLLMGSDGESRGPDRPFAPADWRHVEAVLAQHDLAGLALAEERVRRERGTRPVLPDATQASLRSRYATVGVETRLRLESADRARTVLAEASVASLCFKGGALLLDGTYTDPGARSLEDVDLLVHPGDVDAAIRALEAAGFRPWVPWDRARTRWLSAFTLDDARAPAGVPCTIDLHWSSLYGSLRLSAPTGRDPLWEGADVARGVPAPEAHFVLLADHFFKHLRVIRHLRGLADLARLVPRVSDVDALLYHASARGSTDRLVAIVRALRDLWGVSFAPGLAEALDAAGPPRPAERRYLSPDRLLGARARHGRLGGLLMRWRLDGGVARGAREVTHVLAPPLDWLRARYPDGGGGTLRLRYGAALLAWLLRLGPSPLSPNQEPSRPARREPPTR